MYHSRLLQLFIEPHGAAAGSRKGVGVATARGTRIVGPFRAARVCVKTAGKTWPLACRTYAVGVAGPGRKRAVHEPHLARIGTAARSNQTRSGLCYNRVVVVRNISAAKAELSALIEAVQSGSEVIIAKAGKPVARLVAFRGPARPRTPGAMAGEISIAADFDSLPDDMAEAFGMQEPRS